MVADAGTHLGGDVPTVPLAWVFRSRAGGVVGPLLFGGFVASGDRGLVAAAGRSSSPRWRSGCVGVAVLVG